MSSSIEPGCPLCPPNGKVDILAEMNGMYVVHAKDASLNNMMDRFLMVPVDHVESPEALPLGWGETVVELTRAVGLEYNFNWVMNIGPRAGQTLRHLHMWGCDRLTDNIGKGMDWLIRQRQQDERLIKQLQADLLAERRKSGVQLTGL